jgi:hypothetical protein
LGNTENTQSVKAGLNGAAKPSARAEAAHRLTKLFERQVELEQLAKMGRLKGQEAEAEQEYAQVGLDIEETLRLISTLPPDNPASNMLDAATQAALTELEQLKKRRETLEYMAHAHAAESQGLPPEVEKDYVNVRARISQLEEFLSKDKQRP